MSFPLENNTNAKTQCNTKILYMRKIKYVSGKGMNEEISNNIGKRERWPDVLSQKQQCCSQSAWIEFCIWLSQVWTRNGIAVYRWLPLTHSSPNPSKRNHFSLPPQVLRSIGEWKSFNRNYPSLHLSADKTGIEFFTRLRTFFTCHFTYISVVSSCSFLGKQERKALLKSYRFRIS